jgi:hypothetical protein
MSAIQLTVWVLMVLVSGYVILCNGWIAMAGLVTRRNQPSLVPIVGGLVGAAAFAWAPWERINRLWWLPLVVDLGSLPYLLLASCSVLAEFLRRRGK